MTVNVERARELAADFQYYQVPSEVIAPELSAALGYRITDQDLDLHPVFDTEALIEGVRIARQLVDGRKDLLDLSGLLMLVEARQSVIDAREDWTDMTANELVDWHPDSSELRRWAESDSSGEDDDAETCALPSATFGTFESSLTQAYHSRRGSPSS